MKIVIVIPVYNEEGIIEKNTLRVYEFLEKYFSKDNWKIIISDNNSNDKTPHIARSLSEKFHQIEYLYVHERGKGAAVISAWHKEEADVYVFMDADLSTDLEALPRLIDPIVLQEYDLVCGSRFLKDSRVDRSVHRKLISRGYRFLLKIVLNTKIKDAPCGFKAVGPRLKRDLLPKIENRTWFFDSELVILAQKYGYKIKEIPIHWREPIESGRKSKVKIFSLSREYFKKVLEIRKRLTSI